MNMRSWVSSLFAVVFVMSVSFSSYAVEIIEKNGKKGVFLTESEFDTVLAERLELGLLKNEKIPLLNEKISKLELLIIQKDQEIKILDDTMKKKDELFEASLKLKSAEIDRLEKRLENLDRWYRSPSVYLISGVIIGGALSIGISYGLDK